MSGSKKDQHMLYAIIALAALAPIYFTLVTIFFGV